ncbi:uncharacterized protein HKW66_Vig0190650 [Vigna angularis]|uniref:Integrator complex subunit 3 N-terminal domain-containing protein n=1 Tax=Phaseolus angularis TaxID=3914 RepID=A0A8T0KS45_PHAAN|nr:uncharacterized protein HKW66_Vig0190650 [Vigna angularis]
MSSKSHFESSQTYLLELLDMYRVESVSVDGFKQSVNVKMSLDPSLFPSFSSFILPLYSFVVKASLFLYIRLFDDRKGNNTASGIKLIPLIKTVAAIAKLMRKKGKQVLCCWCFLHSSTLLKNKICLNQIIKRTDLVLVTLFLEHWGRLLEDSPHFKDVAQMYSTRTSSKYSLLRINPDMETQLRFLLTSIKLGHQKRHQVWFAKKFLNEPDKEFVIIDIVRFICCAHHPPNEIIQSDIVPRWALIGWLLTSCRRNHVVANVKLALFYDWLFFDERVDTIMNIEPAVLLMVHSIPKYVDITHALLEFLLHLVDSYDVERKSVLVKGVSSAFQLLVRKGVIRSLDVLISCPALHPALKERLKRLLACGKLESS